MIQGFLYHVLQTEKLLKTRFQHVRTDFFLFEFDVFSVTVVDLAFITVVVITFLRIVHG